MMRRACKFGIATISMCAGLASLLSGAPLLACVLFAGALLVCMLPFGAAIDNEQLVALNRELRANWKADVPLVSVVGFVGAQVSLVTVYGRKTRAALTMWNDESDGAVARSLRTALRHQRANDDSVNSRSSPLAKSPYL